MPRPIRSITAVLLLAAVTASAGEVGTNLDPVEDFSTQYVFVDAFKQSRTWITQTADDFDTEEAGQLQLDADGWVTAIPAPGPGQVFDRVAALLFFGGPAMPYPAGQYIVTFQGTGVIEYRFDAVKNVGASTPGRDVLDVTPDAGFAIVLRSTAAPPNHIRNIRVFMPGFNETTGPAQVFHPDFLSLISEFSTLRFMDWMHTNSSPQVDFADRPLPNDSRFTNEGEGIPLEVMIDLANRTDKKPWFNMPHQATDAYITSFATMVRDNLDPGREIYVEYSNEIWNDQFAQGSFIEEQGIANFPGGGTPFDKRLNQHGQRTAQVCDIWQSVFGGDAARVTCVMGSQAANVFTATQALDCPLSALAPCSAHNVDALAIAPYFGGYLGDPSTAETVAAFTLDQLFTEINSGGVLAGGPPGGAIAETVDWVQDNRAAATARGKELVAYEGGQHLVGFFGSENNQALTDLFGAANRDARMGTAYSTYLNQSWAAGGGELFTHFTSCGSYGKFGNWGAVERLDDQDTPKQNALLNFILASTMSIADKTVTEGNTGTLNATFTVTLTPASASNATVTFATVNGTAVSPADFTATTGTLTFTPGQTTRTFNVPVKGDLLVEGTETFTVQLSGAVNANVSDSVAVGTILDNETAPALSVTDVTVAEGNAGSSNAVFTVSISTASTQPVTVAFATSNGTATAAGAQSFANPAVITIPDEAPATVYPSTISVSSVAGTVTSVDVDLLGISGFPGDLDVLLVGPGGQKLLLMSDPGTATVTGVNLTFDDDAASNLPASGAVVSGTFRPTDITDTFGDDIFPAGAPAGPYATTLSVFNGVNPNGTWQLFVRDDINPDGASFSGGWALRITVAGGDYNATSGTLTFNAGVTSQTVPVGVLGDTTAEANETFNLNLSGATNATIADGQGVGTITNDDAGGLTLSIGDTTVVEAAGGVNAVFTVTLSAASGSPVSVSFATALSGGAVSGVDYTATAGSLTFTAGQTSRTLSVPVLDDATDEATELFFVNLSSPSGATILDGQGKGSIQDDDAEPAISISNSAITEPDTGTQAATFTVTLTPASGRTVTVDFATGAAGTATSGTDYTPKSGSLTFTAGATSRTFKVLLNGDVADEANETYFVNLSNSVNATRADSQAEGTIVDNDPTPGGSPSLTIADTSITEGNTGTVTMTFTVTLSAASASTVPVTFATGAGGTATSGVDYVARTGSVSFTPGQTSKTITVQVNGDLINEVNETMFLNLTSAGNASIADGQAKGTIIDNE